MHGALLSSKNIEPANRVHSCKKMNGMKKIQVVSRNDASKKGLEKNVRFAKALLEPNALLESPFCNPNLLLRVCELQNVILLFKKQLNPESLMGLKLHHITNEPDCLEEVVFQR